MRQAISPASLLVVSAQCVPAPRPLVILQTSFGQIRGLLVEHPGPQPMALLTPDERLFIGRVTVYDGQRLRLRNTRSDLLFWWEQVRLLKLLL